MTGPGDPPTELPGPSTPTPEETAPAPETGSLGNRAARGAAVTLGGQGARMVLQLASVVVLARLLTPDDYGLLAIVLVVVGVGEIFRDFGLSTAAIQARSLSSRQRDGLLWINAGIGATLCLVVLAGAPLLSAAFGRPELTGLARTLSLTFLVNGLATQYRADLTRRMRFGRLVLCDIAGQAAGLTGAIVAASLGAGYWSLAVQQLAQVSVVLVGLVTVARWLPGRPRRDSGVGPMLRLGGRLAGTQLLYYVSNNLDTLTIGIRFTSTDLGLYNRGFQLAMTPVNQLRSPATTVALPVLSRLQSDPRRAAGYIVRGQLTLGYTLVAGLALAVGVARPLVGVMLGPQWTQVVPVFAFLATAAALSTLSFVGFWVYLSRGMGRDLMHYTMVAFVLQLACILTGSLFGVVGVAGGYAVAAALEWPLSLVWLSRRTSLPVRALLQGAARIVVVGVGAALAAFAASRALDAVPQVVAALAGVAAGLAVYGLLSLLCAPIRRDVLAVVDVVRRVARR